MKKWMGRLRHEESGQALVLAALSIVVLLGMAALVIDVGYMQYQKRELQNAVDAASLAAAASFNESTVQNDPTLIGIARNVVERHLGSSEMVENIVIDLDDETVQVIVRQDSTKFFSGVLTRNENSIPAQSTAKAVYNTVPLKWGGDALPFLVTNPSTAYGDQENPSDFIVSSKVGQGYFMNLAKSNQGAYTYSHNPPKFNIVFTHIVDKQGNVDGILSAQGNDNNNLDSDVVDYIKYHQSGDTSTRFHIFSTKENFPEITQGGVVPLSKLLLLEVEVTLIPHNNNHYSGMNVSLKEVYDMQKIANGEFILKNMNPSSTEEVKVVGARIVK